jgi:hypothetical protein
MLTRAFHEAEKLAAENDVLALEERRMVFARRQTRVALVGLAALLYLLFGEWAADKAFPGIVAAHAQGFRLAFIIVGLGGLGTYFALSKRYSDKGQLLSLALELKKRPAEGRKEG